MVLSSSFYFRYHLSQTIRLKSLRVAWNASLEWDSRPLEWLLMAMCLVRVWYVLPFDAHAFSPAIMRLMADIPQQYLGLKGCILAVLAWRQLRGRSRSRGRGHGCGRDVLHLAGRRKVGWLMLGHWTMYACLYGLSEPRAVAWLDRGVLAVASLWVIASLSYHIHRRGGFDPQCEHGGERAGERAEEGDAHA